MSLSFRDNMLFEIHSNRKDGAKESELPVTAKEI